MTTSMTGRYCSPKSCVERGDKILESRKCDTSCCTVCQSRFSADRRVDRALACGNCGRTSRMFHVLLEDFTMAACGVLHEIATTHAENPFGLPFLKLPTLVCMNRVDTNLRWPCSMQVPRDNLRAIAYRMKTGSSGLIVACFTLAIVSAL
jgi:hypothetical protein